MAAKALLFMVVGTSRLTEMGGLIKRYPLMGWIFLLPRGHLNGRAAYRSGVALWEDTVQDDLKNALKKEQRK